MKNSKFRIIDQQMNVAHHLKKNFYLGTLGSFGCVCTSRDVLTNIRSLSMNLDRSKNLSTNPSPRKKRTKEMLQKELIILGDIGNLHKSSCNL
jgi:hypothetical protein